MKLLVLLALLFGSSSALFRWRAGNNLTWANGCSFSAESLHVFKVAGEDCGKMCELDYFCTHFAWRDNENEPKGDCALMRGSSNLAHKLEDNPTKICGKMNKMNGGWITAKDEVMWAKGCELGGNVKDVKDIFAHQCGYTCSQHDDCTHFLWKPITDDRGEGKCILKTGYNQNMKPTVADKEYVCGFINVQ